MDRNKSELTKRYVFFLFGICANAIGIALMTKSSLGTGPTSTIPYAISRDFPIISFGLWTFVFNLVLFAIQVVLNHGKVNKQMLLQIPVTLAFSLVLDGAMVVFSWIDVSNYAVALGVLMIGCVIRAFGVSCQVTADVAMISTEAFVRAVSDRFKWEFSVVKLTSDFLMTIIATIISFSRLHEVVGVREGTLIAIVMVGPVSHYFTERLGFANHYFENEGKFVYSSDLKLEEGKRLVVTVTSESGSGGRVIARILGEKLGIPVYDKELLNKIADAGDFSIDFVRRHNERLYTNQVEAFILENYNMVSEDMEVYRNLYEAQKKAIEELAIDHDCIIVGHCSNYILRDMEGALHIHVTADMDRRISYMEDKYNVPFKKALDMIEHQDDDVDTYYRHFTGEDWKEASNYSMALDSGLFGYEGAADMIEQAVRMNYMEYADVGVREVIRKYHLENKLKRNRQKEEE